MGNAVGPDGPISVTGGPVLVISRERPRRSLSLGPRSLDKLRPAEQANMGDRRGLRKNTTERGEAWYRGRRGDTTNAARRCPQFDSDRSDQMGARSPRRQGFGSTPRRPTDAVVEDWLSE